MREWRLTMAFARATACIPRPMRLDVAVFMPVGCVVVCALPGYGQCMTLELLRCRFPGTTNGWVLAGKTEEGWETHHGLDRDRLARQCQGNELASQSSAMSSHYVIVADRGVFLSSGNSGSMVSPPCPLPRRRHEWRGCHQLQWGWSRV